MNHKSDAKERIIETAARLFQRQGYHATGLGQIVAESHAPKGSLYYYFPEGKEELAVAAIGWTRARIGERIRAVLAQADNPAEAIQGLIRATAASLVEPESIIPCTISLLALETSLCSEPLREACRQTYEDWGNAFAQKLAEGGFDENQAGKLGAMIQMLIDGALISSLTRKDTGPLLDVSEQIPALLRRG